MCLIQDDAVRQVIEHTLSLCRDVESLSRQNVSMEFVDAYTAALMASNREKVVESARLVLEPELSLAYLGTLTLGMTSLAAEHDTPILPVGWIRPDGRPNPSHILSTLLNTLANSALAVIQLTESGLESPARVVLRSFLELSWLAIVALARRELMVAYCQASNGKEEKKLFFTHFAPKGILKKLVVLEQELGFSPDLIEVLSQRRENLYGYYSKSTHSSFSSAVFGSYAFTGEDHGILVRNLFGHADHASYPTLYHLNDGLFYFFAMLDRILRGIHQHQAPYTQRWQEVLALQEAFKATAKHPFRHERASELRFPDHSE